MKVKKPKDYYRKSTAKWARRAGDAIMGLGALFTTISALVEAEKAWIIASAIVGYVGKTVMNFFAEDDSPKTYSPDSTDVA